MTRTTMRRFERDGRWCEVGTLRHARHDDMPCYEIGGRGDVDFYLGDGVLLGDTIQPDDSIAVTGDTIQLPTLSDYDIALIDYEQDVQAIFDWYESGESG